MIKAIAIDDEPLALKLVTKYINETPFLEYKGSFENPLTAMEFLKNNSVDLIFLDIQMPDLNGTDFARTLNNESKIIFTTAFEKYALQGFQLEALDYLLKPFSFEEFTVSAKKAQKIFDLQQKANATIEANNNFLFIKSEYKIRRINFNEITYIEGLKDYVKIFLKNEPKPILSINSLKALEIKLPESKFMRVHRSFIVNLEHITTIDRARIVFGSVFIPISDQYKDKFHEYLDENFL